MASGTTLKLKFGTANGEKTFNYNYANSGANAASVKTLMNTMIANGSIFKYPPLTKVSAYFEITTEREVDIDD